MLSHELEESFRPSADRDPRSAFQKEEDSQKSYGFKRTLYNNLNIL